MAAMCLFRVEAGLAVGLGHFKRCIVLAKTLRLYGVSSIFWMSSADEWVVRNAKLNGVGLHVAPVAPGSEDDLDQLTSFVNRTNPDWLIVDGYEFGPTYLLACRTIALRLMLIQDAPADTYGADILLNQNLGVSTQDYSKTNTKALIGPEYCLMDGVRRALPRRRLLAYDARVLITLGAIDVARQTLSVVESLAAIDVSLSVVIGPMSGWRHSEFAHFGQNVQVHWAPDDIDCYVKEADVGVMSMGTTTWIMAFYGLPFVMLPTRTEQAPTARWLEDGGFAVNGLANGKYDPEHFVTKIKALLAYPDQMRQIAAKLMTLVDGEGAQRVIREMGF